MSTKPLDDNDSLIDVSLGFDTPIPIGHVANLIARQLLEELHFRHGDRTFELVTFSAQQTELAEILLLDLNADQYVQITVKRVSPMRACEAAP